MAKKRSMPHGRTIAKGKKAKAHTYRPVAADVPQQEETLNRPAAATPPPPPPVLPPRSAPRASFGAARPTFGAPRTGYGTRTARSAATGLSTDYRYVISDLKRIAVLAGATFAVLIGLAFVIK